MHPNFLDNMSWEMAEVYGAITDQILINLSRHFPFYVAGESVPKSAFAYQAQMLAQMGQINAETVRIIRNGLADADPALVNCLEQSIIDSVKATEPELARAVKKGVFAPPTKIVVSPNQTRAFQLYYKQASDNLNLVNTVMLESTQSAYKQAVADVVSEVTIAQTIERTQSIIDTAAGEAITGVSSWNQALRHACDKMNNGGIVGFIDHAGHRWSAEAYVAMDIRTTVYNTGRAAVWETNEDFGNDLYSVSYHNGARPLCYPWQNKVISRLDAARTVVDLDGNAIEVIAQSATSYGAPAGLFGINCKHYPTPFIPGVSVLTGQPQNEEDNKQTYAESQEQRRLERKLREEKRDYLTAKAQGRPQEELDALQQKCRNTSGDIDEFCKKTGRARHRDREGVYTKREFPDSQKYNVADFERWQKESIEEFYKTGGAQQRFTAGQMIPNETLVANPPAMPAPAGTANPAVANYGKPFDDTGYRPAQKKQIEDARQTLENAPEEARQAWLKVSDKLKTPDFNSSNSGAYYRSSDKRVHFKTYKKAFAESDYQRKNACWFHEYGHNLDELLGNGGWDGRISATYTNKSGETLVQLIDKECDNALKQFYLHEHGVKDTYEAVKAAYNEPGSMGFGSFTRQMLKGVMPGEEFRAIRDTLFDAGDDDAFLRPLVEKWLTPNFEKEMRTLYHSKANGTAFKEWVCKTYSMYQRTDISDMFEPYMVKTFGKSYQYPFGIGHGASYWNYDGHTAASEGFAEMYSALVTQNDSLDLIKEFFPETYEMFLEMLVG